MLREPQHGSWLNLVEGFFSKLARSVLRHIRVTSKQELKHRIMAAMDHFNQDPVVRAWSYKLDRVLPLKGILGEMRLHASMSDVSSTSLRMRGGGIARDLAKARRSRISVRRS